MANVKKFKLQQLGNIFAHYDRTAENPKENIDISRTHLNYNLAPNTEQKQIEILHQRLGQVKVQKRADVNLVATWVVTVPKTLPEQKHEEFFRQSYLFLENRYGKDNVVSAYVHNDENTPHLHFAFVPVVHDQKYDRLKVSAKECITIADLNSFHGELQGHLEKELGCEVEILNEATRDGNQSITDLKRKSAVERLEEANEKAEQIVRSAQIHARVIEETAKPIEAECEAKKEILQALANEPSRRGIELKKPIMGESYYKVEPKRMEELLTKEKAFQKANEVNEQLAKELGEIKNTLTYKQFSVAVGRYSKLANDLAAEQLKNEQLKKDLDRYVQKYGVLAQEPQQQEAVAKPRYRSRKRDRTTSMEY